MHHGKGWESDGVYTLLLLYDSQCACVCVAYFGNSWKFFGGTISTLKFDTCAMSKSTCFKVFADLPCYFQVWNDAQTDHFRGISKIVILWTETNATSAEGEKNKWLVQRVSTSQNLGNSSSTRFRFSSDLGPVCTKRPGTRRQHRLSADLSQSARKIEMGAKWAKKWMKTLIVPSMLPMLPPFWDFFLGGCLLDCNPGHRFTLICTDRQLIANVYFLLNSQSILFRQLSPELPEKIDLFAHYWFTKYPIYISQFGGPCPHFLVATGHPRLHAGQSSWAPPAKLSPHTWWAKSINGLRMCQSHLALKIGYPKSIDWLIISSHPFNYHFPSCSIIFLIQMTIFGDIPSFSANQQVLRCLLQPAAAFQFGSETKHLCRSVKTGTDPIWYVHK